MTSLYQKCSEETSSVPQVVWKLMPSTPIGRAINGARHRLTEAKISTANRDACIILAHVLQQDQVWIFTNYDYELDTYQAERYAELVTRRIAHEPLTDLIKC